jgi:hypothetical protein
MTPTPAPAPQRPLGTVVRELGDDLRSDLALVRDASARLREAEQAAWRAYTEQVHEIVEEMERDLSSQREALDAARDERSAEARAAFRELVERAHRSLDEVRVQEALAELEVRDHLGNRWDALTTAVAGLQTSVRTALDWARGEHTPDTDGGPG